MRQFEKLGRKPKALIALEVERPQCPPALRYLFDYFQEIILGLSANGFSIPAISWETLRAWCDLRAIKLETWESLALVELGHIRVNVLTEKAYAVRDQE